jgi:UDP-2,3-diacylglucosamine hydrolase
MKTLFIADVHLKVNDSGKVTREAFVQFLRSIDPAECERIILLGDLFDFWFEYKQVIFSGYFEVLAAFRDLELAGVQLHLICGNHDFWAGRFLREHLHICIHPNDYHFTLGDQRILCVHGDGINPQDRSYRIYKKIARHPWVVGAFSLLHPDWAMRLAQGVSHSSRTMLAPDDPAESGEVRALRTYAEEELSKGTADVIICGHSHFPEEKHFPSPTGSGFYFNAGDWLEKRTYLIWENGEFTRAYYEED